MSLYANSLSRAQVRELDRLAIEEYGIPGVVLMENAGLGAAQILLEHEPDSVAILCGSGNNGGDGYVVARVLANEGVRVRVFEFAPPGRLRGDALSMQRIVAAMAKRPGTRIELLSAASCSAALLAEADYVVDGLLGTGFHGEVREPMCRGIEQILEARERGIRVLALDIPSGLDADSGEVASPTVRADVTVTFAALKTGLLNSDASGFIGELHVVPIGAPLELVERVSDGF